MFKVVRDHPKVLWTIIILIILVSILSVYEKQKYKANPYEILRGKIRYLMIHIIMKNLVIMRKRLMKK